MTFLIKEDIFLSHLLEETYSILPEEEKNSLDFHHYFEAQALREQGFEIFRLEFLQSNSCFRLKYNSTFVDFPSNWSQFEYLSSFLKKDEMIFHPLHEKDFDEVFSALTSYKSAFAFLSLQKEIYLLSIPEEKKFLFDDLQKKWGLPKEGPIKKAA